MCMITMAARFLIDWAACLAWVGFPHPGLQHFHRGFMQISDVHVMKAARLFSRRNRRRLLALPLIRKMPDSMRMSSFCLAFQRTAAAASRAAAMARTSLPSS